MTAQILILTAQIHWLGINQEAKINEYGLTWMLNEKRAMFDNVTNHKNVNHSFRKCQTITTELKTTETDTHVGCGHTCWRFKLISVIQIIYCWHLYIRHLNKCKEKLNKNSTDSLQLSWNSISLKGNSVYVCASSSESGLKIAVVTMVTSVDMMMW